MKIPLYLITNDFPYGDGEGSFILPELPYLMDKFKITIISTSLSPQRTEQVNADIKVIHYTREASIMRKLLDALCYFGEKDAYQELAEIIKTKTNRLGKLMESVLFYEEARRFRRFLKKENIIDGTQTGVVYCYWYTFYCYTVLKLFAGNSKLKIITRTHRYDLYDEGSRFGRQMFKRQMDRNLDAVVFIAEHGREYYLEKYQIDKKMRDKYVLFRLGVQPVLNPELLIVKDKKEFLLVSCSLIIPRKRVQLIVDGLSLIDDFQVRWIHFGDGIDFEKLKAYAYEKLNDKSNIYYEFKGTCKTDEIMQFYTHNEVDAFITTTQSEGCPVSVQEAMACGIPVIGTAVAEIPYMIRENGILLVENPNGEEIANAIGRMHNLSYDEKMSMRNKSYDLWNKEFNAANNASRFTEFLYGLTQKCY